MFLHLDIITATPSHENGATIDISEKKNIEISVDVGCASPEVSFTWSIKENAESSSKSCTGNLYFNTSKSVLRIDNPTEDKITLLITHPTLKSRNYTWNLKCK